MQVNMPSFAYIKERKVNDLIPCVTISSVIKLFMVNLSSTLRYFQPHLWLQSITVLEVCPSNAVER